MSSNPETFVEHMWPWIAHTLTGHVLAMAREGLIGQDIGETLAAAIDRVREQPAADEDLVSLVRSFEQLLAAQLTPEVEAASRVGRSIVDVRRRLPASPRSSVSEHWIARRGDARRRRWRSPSATS